MIDRLKQSADDLGADRVTKFPAGWTPGIEMKDSSSGVLVTRPSAKQAANWEEELRSWGFDPALYEVIEPVQYRTWEMYTTAQGVVQLHYYKANIRSRTEGVLAADAESMKRSIAKHRAKALPLPGEQGFVFAIADPQVGKPGSDATIGRWMEAIDRATDQIRFLRSAGVSIGEVWVLTLGDLIEQCDGFYSYQAFDSVLNRRDQITVAYRALWHTIRELAPLSSRLVVAGVGGNHGENRTRGGKVVTGPADNDDLLITQMALDLARANEDAYGHVEGQVPDSALSISMEIAGWPVGLAHGHQMGSRKRSSEGVLDWWAKQTFGGLNVAQARLLLTGHFHSLRIVEDGSRVWCQCPTLDDGSAYYAERTGSGADSESSGVLTMTVGPQGPDHFRKV